VAIYASLVGMHMLDFLNTPQRRTSQLWVNGEL